MTLESRLFIDGSFVESKDGATFPTVNPATEDVIQDVSMAGPDDVTLAVAAGERASKSWWEMDARDRGRILFEAAKAIEDHGEELARLDSLDAGRPIADCHEDIHAAAGMFRYFAGLTDKIHGTTIPVQNDKLCYTRREPYGVVAAITAWNYPLFNASAKIAPVLATGNACILKPAEESPLTALCLARALQEVPDLPKGLINVLNGPGESTGALLTNHARIGKVTFTGGTDTGREILRASANSNLKSVTLELGGKSPYVIMDDADLEMALNGIIFSVFFNQGQTCTAGTRLLVQRTVMDAAITGLKERMGRIKVGDPSAEESMVGPLISEVQYQKAMGYINRAREAGTRLLAGGGRPSHMARGYYIEPTLFAEPDRNSELATDEIFGPVLVVQPFDTDEEGLALANATSYGLAASVWSGNSQRLLNFGHRLEAGIIWCNTVFQEHPGAPAGGYKQSGFGREFGLAAVEEYTRLKTMWVDLSGEHFAWA